MGTTLKTRTRPIKVGILDISPQNKAVIEFFFDNSGRSLFNKSNYDEASAFIIDFDCPGAKASWAKIYKSTRKPVIIFSFKNIDLPSAIWVPKPLTAKALTDAGLEIKKIINANRVEEKKPEPQRTEAFPSINLDSLIKPERIIYKKTKNKEASTNEIKLKEEIAKKPPKIPSGHPIESSTNVSIDTFVEKVEQHSKINKTETNAYVDIPLANKKIEGNDSVTTDREIEQFLDIIQDKLNHASNTDSGGKPKPYIHKRKLTVAEQRWALLCGENDDIGNAKEIKNMSFNPDSKMPSNLLASEVKNISYNTKSHMFSGFLLAIRQAKRHLQVIEMKYANRIMVIDHKHDCIYCNHAINTESYAQFCFDPANQGDFTTRVLNEDEINLCRKNAELTPETTYSIESFIWTSSMLTSRGRLPQRTDINQKIKLKNWPDLTRLEQIPHAIRIAAVFYKHPGNMLEVSHWLNIPQRYVFSFYNAVLALDMIEIQKTTAQAPSFYSDNNTIKKPKNRGLFSRLLTKLAA